MCPLGLPSKVRMDTRVRLCWMDVRLASKQDTRLGSEGASEHETRLGSEGASEHQFSAPSL